MFGFGGAAEFVSETIDLTGGSHMAVAQVKAAFAGASSTCWLARASGPRQVRVPGGRRGWSGCWAEAEKKTGREKEKAARERF